MLSPGDKVKDCEIIAPLGSGGMATLYLARRRGVGGFSRLVTLKLVHQHLAEDENIIKLFLEEARISAHVAHPNVVRVEEVGRYNGAYFIAMEYVHGVSLAELLTRLTERRLCLRPKLCVWLAAQIAEALHAAHEATGESGLPMDVVHRDVSPQNVLLSHTGHVKLIDFGLAKTQEGDDPYAGEQTVLGKLRYMSPEQLRLERADRRTDVYALGVMLWEMLAGRSLLRCQRYDDERDWAIRENPPPPSHYAPHPMPSLDRAVLRAIAYEQDERYESAFQFRAALLRAEPSVLQLDAPMVASLLRSMLGEELDKRRASWPIEVAGELEAASDQTGSQRYRLEELTAEHRNLSALLSDPDDDEDTEVDVDGDVERIEDEPTLSMYSAGGNFDTLAAVRADLKHALNAASVEYDSIAGLRVENAVVMLPAPVVPARERTLLGMPINLPQSAIDTLRIPPVSVALRELMPAGDAFKSTAVGSICLAAGFVLGLWVNSGPPPRAAAAVESETRAATDAPPRTRAPAPPQFASVILTSPHPKEPRLDASWYLVNADRPPAPLKVAESAYDEDSEVPPELESARAKSASRKEARTKNSRRSASRSAKAEKLTSSTVRKSPRER